MFGLSKKKVQIDVFFLVILFVRCCFTWVLVGICIPEWLKNMFRSTLYQDAGSSPPGVFFIFGKSQPKPLSATVTGWWGRSKEWCQVRDNTVLDMFLLEPDDSHCASR